MKYFYGFLMAISPLIIGCVSLGLGILYLRKYGFGPGPWKKEKIGGLNEKKVK